jgi:hypothetical protein
MTARQALQAVSLDCPSEQRLCWCMQAMPGWIPAHDFDRQRWRLGVMLWSNCAAGQRAVPKHTVRIVVGLKL